MGPVSIMTSSKKEHFFSFNIKVLKLCLLWPDRANYVYDKSRLLKDSALILSLMPCAIPITVDFILQVNDGFSNLTAAVEDMIALICILGMIYMVICFLINRRTVVVLMDDIKRFEKYCSSARTKEVDDRANFLSKIFMFYGIMGNFMYLLMPQLSVNKCHEKRTEQMVKDGVPCGMVVRSVFPFKFDRTPLYEIIFVHQIYTCTMVSVLVLVLTMLMCGFSMHICNQLGNLRDFIETLQGIRPQEQLVEGLLRAIIYHIDIIRYSQKTGKAFSGILLFYVSIISLILSVLCFEVIMVDALEDSVRFAFHLLGWLVILFSICYSGQLIIDQSIEVANAIYALDWFNFPPDVQEKVQMIIMRSQKPLVMDAAGMGVVSLQIFLNVLKSAYSFFTLLLKFKQ